ncbi:FtsX-like permease family protein [Paenibacillus sp. LMG 31456]|uniref:FtsX-like permease family protein n=1 Tax=Paenibacillus foliorum TaxID=2654974 RepID=A0A972GP22_9BACL|nr:FtsX-like permease family protein [Paenibacillus foliorum]NOU93808.1 FtsX-like permease family protein [Paenibacillus foliorum]
MAIFVMIIRKMVKNKWLEFSLLLGLIISVGLVSSMPIYTNAILQRLLIKDLEQLQDAKQQFPGIFWNSVYITGELTSEQAKQAVQDADQYMGNEAPQRFQLPIKEYVIERATDRWNMVPVDAGKIDSSIKRTAEVAALSGMEDHVRLIDGKLPSSEPVDGVIEAVVVDQGLTNLKMVVGQEYTIQDEEVKTPIKFKIVGVIDRKDYNDVYWYNSLSTYSSSMIVSYDWFEKEITRNELLKLRSSTWYLAVDYSQMKLESIERFIGTYQYTESFLANHFPNYTLKAPALPTLNGYFVKEEKLRLMLWSLNVPVMIMLAYYLFMVSNLIIDRQKTEIAVLRSRGASRLQIVLGYVVEGILLGGIALACGPFFGLIVTKTLGASNGFLEFVQRAALDVKLNRTAFQYGVLAVLCSLVMTLLPVLFATRATIVGHKQQMARQTNLSFWHKYFIDVILLAISLYGLYTFRTKMRDMQSLGLDVTDLQMDPMLFLIPALFILGASFLLLRIYPWLVRLIYQGGRRWWPPSLYSTLLQVGRSITQYQTIMVFLSVTLATGLFSASAARTINKNADEKIMYGNGADITMTVKWEDDAPPPSMGNEGGGEGDPTVLLEPKKKVQFSEPPFFPFTQLSGVEHAAKVFTKPNAIFTFGKERGTATLMGIDTDDFGNTAWLREGLLDHHFYDYLNVLASSPSAVIISRTLADQYNVKVGDHLYAGWDGVQSTMFNVFAIVDYWPSWNPNPLFSDKSAVSTSSAGSAANSKNKKIKAPMLIVGHLSYIQNNMALEPYDVWMTLKPNAKSQELYDALEEKKIPVTKLNDAKQELIRSKNDPFLLAINGVMTLGFIISIVISFFGFLLYWVLSLSGRVLQFGILRAMGISFRQLIMMLIGEQLLTSGAAVVIGMLTGNLTSRFFVPMFQLSMQTSSQVPPFQVTFDPRDQMQLYIIVSIMLTVGLFILGTMLSRVKIHQAVKLGED